MGRKIFALSVVVGGGTMLTGLGVIVFQPYSFLSSFVTQCFGGGISGGAIEAAGSALYVMMALVPFALASSLWRRIVHLRERGLTNVADSQSVADPRNHPVLRVLSNATIVLALIAGGLLVQAGYLAELTSDY